MFKKITAQQSKELLLILSDRFDKNMYRHEHINKDDIFSKIKSQDTLLCTLFEMERTGGEPDVVLLSKEKSEITFTDCAIESPAGRRSLCYDETALARRKENKPKASALGLALEMGTTLLTEEQYKVLQQVMHVDLKTSSWLLTPDDIRKKGGAIFGDKRYNHTFIYHNGAESYYASRGFRCLVKVRME
ncbi:MAG: DUF4256 domain-containing protein [Cyclobacteriaceae bacterium]|jgi:hypothetical protein|nr:DUF4256 domain-containing protein [Cyclobacteriaceae bacterium]